MASNVTLLSMRNQAKQRADMQKSNFVSDEEWNNYINLAARELYDILVSKAEDYFTIKTDLTANGNDDYIELPEDFYKAVGVDYFLGGVLQPMANFMFQDRHTYQYQYIREMRYRIVGQERIYFNPRPAPQTIHLWYVPVLPLLVDDDDTFNGVNGWEDYIIIMAAIKALVKEETDTSELQGELNKMHNRIENMGANRDQGRPERVTDINNYNAINNFLVADTFIS